MRRRRLATPLLFVAAALALTTPHASAAPVPVGWVKQVGTYDYLVTPDYDGLQSLRDVVGNASIGLGTFDHLDGELVLLGGTVYKVGTDGAPVKADLATTTPFFEGVRFSPQETMLLPAGTACADVLPIIDSLAGTSNGVVALRMTGTFDSLTTRSVPRQDAPYPPLSEVVANQTVFPLGTVGATLVGFRTGTDVKGIGAPGVHLHGLTADRSAGGHVLSCATGRNVRLSIQVTRGFQVRAD